jgi:hypothetical protein
MTKPSPCMGCTERFTACHDRCPKDARGEYGYLAWKHEREEFAKATKLQSSIAWTAARRRAHWASLRRDHPGVKKRFT